MNTASTADGIDLPLLHRGKVRDIYDAGNDELLIITSDRLSAFDVILPTPIPGKGEVLTQISNFWFHYFRDLLPNHLSDTPLETIIPNPALRQRIAARATVAKKLEALPVEAIVRGYLVGSGWKDYQASGSICGIALPAGLQLAEPLPEPIYTPSTKAAVGDHDENIRYETTRELLGADIAQQVRDYSLAIYRQAADYARARGILIADTKLEFGVDAQGVVHLIDEVLTPDSSRFWPREQWRPGISPPSFDKQFVRDYLETLDWDKTAPGPALPEEIVTRTAEKYRRALDILTTDP